MYTTHTGQLSKEWVDARNRALLAAEHVREVATHEADVEYSETVYKLRERFEADLAEATTVRLVHVAPAHRAYNASVVAAEHGQV
jgi:hypothetical protein